MPLEQATKYIREILGQPSRAAATTAVNAVHPVAPAEVPDNKSEVVREPVEALPGPPPPPPPGYEHWHALDRVLVHVTQEILLMPMEELELFIRDIFSQLPSGDAPGPEKDNDEGV